MLQSHHRARRLVAVATMAALAALLAGCARMTPPTLDPGEDPLNVIYIAKHDSITPSSRQMRVLPSSAYRPQWFFLARRKPPRQLPFPGKIHGALAQAMAVLPGSTPVRVMITFTDTVKVPVFPRLVPEQVRDALGKNATALDSVQLVVANLRQLRGLRYGPDTLALKNTYGATILDTYWLIQAISAVMPLDRVNPLAARTDVLFIRLDAGPQAPHHDGVPDNDMDAARASIGSDHYFDLGPAGGYMALIDTGVRSTHRLLCNPSSLCMVADCYSTLGTLIGPKHCSPWDPKCQAPGAGDTYVEGHGTSSAAILVGNGASLATSTGDAHTPGNRGVTTASLDCFQVYDGERNLSAGAAVKAFELARERLDHVIVAEMQDTSAAMADVAKAADNAYLTGAVVVAANGNFEGAGTGFPARGRRVIGVGAYHLQFDAYVQGQAWGSTDDGRVKPDIVAPSYTETATNGGDDAMGYFTGTSGATPYAAGAALLLRNWMTAAELNPSFDPGQVYAHLILAGDEVGPFSPTSRHGAGRIHLPAGGSSWYGKVWVSEATRSVDVPIDIAAGDGIKKLSAAIWWPETTPTAGGPPDTHNDVDLAIVSPGLFGSAQATSAGRNGVFERAVVSGSPTLSGRWILRINSYTQRTGPQIVYWAASLMP